MRRREIDADEEEVLGVLSEAAAEGGGWKRGGVRGWLLGSEINSATGSPVASDSCQRLRRAGLVRGEAAWDPGRLDRPAILWRITQRGEEEIAGKHGRTPAQLPVPRVGTQDEGVIYVSREVWRCLAALQKNDGWLRWVELQEQVERRYHDWAHLDDVHLLVRRGLAEREARPGERRSALWLRATARGRGVRLLDGRTSPAIVQIRLPPEGDEGGRQR
jgi:hypothetical protein